MPSPAWGASSDLWFRTLKPLEKILTIVYLDSRGTGRSQHAKSTKDYAWDNLVADLDALRAHLKQEKVWLMGHSEGGIQVLHYACKHPERINGLVLLSSAVVSDEKSQGEWQVRVLRQKDEPWFGEAMQALKTDYSSDAQLKAGFAKMLPLYWSDPHKIDKYHEDFEATAWSADAFHGARDSNRSQYDLTEPLKRVKAPALIVVGDGDFICWPENTKQLHLSLPDSKLLVIERAGHFPWLEQPDAFFRDVPIFLQALGLTGKQ
jgi:proline iminopeptidase